MSFAIRRAVRREERDAAVALRERVFVREQGVPKSDEIDGRDDDSLHLVAVDEEDRIIGTCRLFFAGSSAQFSRLAVEPDARRRRIASGLLDEAEQEAIRAGSRRVVLHAQTYARELYESHGYERRGAVFWEAGIEHVAMEKRLA